MDTNKQNRSREKGSDKQHPETPPDANERARRNNKVKDKKNKPIEEDPGSQMTS